MKQLITLFLALFLASLSWSQEADEPGETPTAATEVSESSEERDDSDLDEQGYGEEEEEDDFIPSQEVSADQSLPFPVDI